MYKELSVAFMIAASLVAGTASAGVVLDINAGYFEPLGTGIFISNTSSLAFDDFWIASVAGNGAGSTAHFGPVAAYSDVTYFFDEPSGVFSVDADDFYYGDAVFQVDAVIGGQTFKSETFSTSVNATGHYLGFQGDTDFGPTKVATLIVRQASVPEPASWVLMILGFGASGAVVRASRRRRSIPPAARA